MLMNNLFGQTTGKQIEDLVQKYADYGEFNGSVLVAQNNKVIFKKGYGFSNFEQKTSNTTTTKFYIGFPNTKFVEVRMHPIS